MSVWGHCIHSSVGVGLVCRRTRLHHAAERVKLCKHRLAFLLFKLLRKLDERDVSKGECTCSCYLSRRTSNSVAMRRSHGGTTTASSAASDVARFLFPFADGSGISMSLACKQCQQTCPACGMYTTHLEPHATIERGQKRLHALVVCCLVLHTRSAHTSTWAQAGAYTCAGIEANEARDLGLCLERDNDPCARLNPVSGHVSQEEM